MHEFIVKSSIPVILGNIVGGDVLDGVVYYILQCFTTY